MHTDVSQVVYISSQVHFLKKSVGRNLERHAAAVLLGLLLVRMLLSKRTADYGIVTLSSCKD
jgi:hypothetical protein